MLVAVVPYLVRMRTILRPAAAAVVLVAALAATACTPQPQPPSTPAPSSTPLFASDEEALAAAEAAYAAYQTTEDLVFAEGGVQGERIQAVAVRDALQAANNGFESFREKGYRASGMTSFDTVKLQDYEPNVQNGEDIVSVYMCLDFTQTDVLDASGKSVVREGRALRQPFEMRFDALPGERKLVLSSRSPWTDSGQCIA
jgi:hypothetical protein